MKSFLAFLWFMCGFLPVILGQNVKNEVVNSPIQAVTVFLEGAEVLHVETLTLSPGRTEIVFRGLSASLLPSAIRVNTGQGVSVLSVSHKINYLTRASEKPRIRQAKDSLNLISAKIGLLNDEKGALTTEKEMMLKNQSIGGQTNGVPVAELQKAADFYYSRIFEINKKLSEIELSMLRLNETLENLKKELETLNAKYNFSQSEISVLVSTETQISREIELRYYVNGCGWTPYYDLRAVDVDQPITLTYMAKVFNNTGIDWENMNMTLSTADPTQSARQPELKPWGLNFSSAYDYDKEFYQSYNNNRAPDANKTKQQGNVIYEEIEVSQLSVEFPIIPRYSIPADSRPYIVEVASHQLPATYKHVCVPKLDRDAFLLARITGWEDLDLVEAPANIFFGGSFVGESYIATRSVNDTLDISLGRDKKVMVTRTKLKDFSSEPFIGSKRKESYKFEIAVKNNRKVPVNIEIQDQVPVSENSEIEVSVENISKAGHNVLTGILKWNLNLESGKSETLQLSYSVRYPKNKSLRSNPQEKRKQFRAAKFL